MKLSAGFVMLFCLPAFAAHRFDITHLDKLQRVADPQFSPDGKAIVVVVSRPNYTEDRYDADLVLVDVPGGRPHTLTHDRRAVRVDRLVLLVACQLQQIDPELQGLGINPLVVQPPRAVEGSP